MTWTRWTRRAPDQVTPIGCVLKLRLSQVLVIEHDDEPDETVIPHEILLAIPDDTGVLVHDTPPTPDGWGYKVFEEFDDAANNDSYWITVPEPQTGVGDTADTAIDDNDLPHVQGSDLAPRAPATPAWVAALQAAVAVLQAAIDGKVDQADLTAAVSALVAAAPGALDTLNELAAALGDDPNFATTVTNLIGANTAAIAAEAALARDAGNLTTGTIPDARIPTTIARDSEVAASIDAALNAILDGAPDALNTLNELAAAVNDDAAFAPTVISLLAGKVPTTRTVNGHALTSDVTVSKADVGLGSVDNLTVAQLVQWARNPDQLIVGSVTRDANDAITSAPVVWPDGTPGTFTADVLSTNFPGAVDAYHVTYGSPVAKTFTQPAVTRNANGAVTALPAIVVT